MIQLGSFQIKGRVFVAPMAGVTDRPFRQLCRRLGAAYAVSEMASSQPSLMDSVKTKHRLNHDGEYAPIAVQITGADPQQMAMAARYNFEHGADIVDINMGCPARKVCRVLSGSALMRDLSLAQNILKAVLQVGHEVGKPVTLKMRTGWDSNHKNAPELAKIAEDLGIAMIVIHGRTREDLYRGEAEYETIAQVVSQSHIPVIANGDITNPYKAKYVLDYTKASAVMIGRAAQGNPWIFHQIQYYLDHGVLAPILDFQSVKEILLHHLSDHYAFYGEHEGVRSARKHISWYLSGLPTILSCSLDKLAYDEYIKPLKQSIYKAQTTVEQTELLSLYLSRIEQYLESI